MNQSVLRTIIREEIQKVLSESAINKYYDIEWVRNNEKEIYDYKVKLMDVAEKAMQILSFVLEKHYPGKFDVDTMGFAFQGNAAFVYCDTIGTDRLSTIDIDFSPIQNDSNFKKFFDLASPNFGTDSSKKLYSSCFRLKSKIESQTK